MDGIEQEGHVVVENFEPDEISRRSGIIGLTDADISTLHPPCAAAHVPRLRCSARKAREAAS